MQLCVLLNCLSWNSLVLVPPWHRLTSPWGLLGSWALNNYPSLSLRPFHPTAESCHRAGTTIISWPTWWSSGSLYGRLRSFSPALLCCQNCFFGLQGPKQSCHLQRYGEEDSEQTNLDNHNHIPWSDFFFSCLSSGL